MITFRPMSSLAGASLRASILALFVAGSATAQVSGSPLSHLDDAAPIPAGALRLRIANVWTRYDERFAAGGGMTSLGAELSTDSLGVSQLPLLTGVQSAVRTLAASPALRLSFGTVRVGSNARIVTTPFSLEYGISRRLSVGVLIPVVETRRVAQATVIGDVARANMGFLAFQTQRTQAATQNRAVATAYQGAADSLGKLVAQCPANPTAAGCAAVNANPADAAAARVLAQSFAQAATALGITEATAVVAPRATSDLATSINASRVQLNLRLQQYLGATAGANTSVFTAPSDFSYRDLQGDRATGARGLLSGQLGGGLDSIHTTERVGFGDIAVGARYLVFDRFQRDSLPPPRVQTRLMVGGAVRFATSRPDSAQSLLDIATGDGAGVDVNSAMDLIVGHLGATVGLRYGKSFARTVQASLIGDPEAPFPYPLFGARARTAGDVLGLDLTPRLLLTATLALDAHYGLERVGPTTYGPADIGTAPGCIDMCTISVPGSVSSARTAQRVGFGFRYSTVDAYARGRAPYPVQVSFARLSTISGDPGLPNQTRDQIEVRLFYQLLRRR
jgi:hypothetical protein